MNEIEPGFWIVQWRSVDGELLRAVVHVDALRKDDRQVCRDYNGMRFMVTVLRDTGCASVTLKEFQKKHEFIQAVELWT
jgi:hypothetical protein